MERIANNYNTAQKKESIAPGQDLKVLNVIEEEEIVDFLSGKATEVSETVKSRVKKAMESTGSKINLFLAAYAQKGMSKLARLMQVLDDVEAEAYQDYRLRTMSTGQVMDLLSDLNIEKHRSIKEMVEIGDKFEQNKDFGSTRVLDNVDEKVDVEDVNPRRLARQSKKNIIKFYKQKIVGA